MSEAPPPDNGDQSGIDPDIHVAPEVVVLLGPEAADDIERHGSYIAHCLRIADRPNPFKAWSPG